MTQDKYWTFILNDETFDADFETMKEADEHAQGVFDQQCEDDGLHGYSMQLIELIEYYYDDEGERKITKKEKGYVEYAHYRGDFAEHNIMHDLV